MTLLTSEPRITLPVPRILTLMTLMMRRTWAVVLGVAVAVGVGLLGGCAGGDGKPGVTAAAIQSPEQQACAAWGAAFRPQPGTGAVVSAVRSAAAIAPQTPSGRVMNIFLAATALPGTDPSEARYLVQVQQMCAAIGAGFSYPPA